MYEKMAGAPDLEMVEELLPILTDVLEYSTTHAHSSDGQIIRESIDRLSDSIDAVSQVYSIVSMANVSRDILMSTLRSLCNCLDEALQLLSQRKPSFELRLESMTAIFPIGSFSVSVLDRSGQRGRPKAIVNEQQVRYLNSLGLTWKKIAHLIGVSDSTLLRTRRNFSASCSHYVDIDENELDRQVSVILERNAQYGERMLTGALIDKGIKVRREHLRKSINRVRPFHLRAFPGARRIVRRKYGVRSSNALWHIDGNHKLIRWRFVVHGGIDGFSRLIVFLRCSTNNEARTVLSAFRGAVEEYGVPEKIRTDHGTENVAVARFMLQQRGVETNPVLTGKSVHNQRIERLWVDMRINVTQYFIDTFRRLEEQEDLDPLNDYDLFALHYVFRPRINLFLKEFAGSWNNHALRTEHNCSPIQLWTSGFSNTADRPPDANSPDILYGIDWNDPTPELETCNNVQVPRSNIVVSEEQHQWLSENVDPLSNDDAGGTQLYREVKNYILDLNEPV